MSAAEPSVSCGTECQPIAPGCGTECQPELSVSRSRLACGTECQLACGTECQPIAPGRSRMSDRAYRSRNQRPQAKTPKSRVPAAKRGVSRPRTADRAWPANRTCPIAHIDRAWPNAKSGVRNLVSVDRAWANAKPGVRDLVCETWCQPNAKPGVRDLVSRKPGVSRSRRGARNPGNLVSRKPGVSRSRRGARNPGNLVCEDRKSVV